MTSDPHFDSQAVSKKQPVPSGQPKPAPDNARKPAIPKPGGRDQDRDGKVGSENDDRKHR